MLQFFLGNSDVVLPDLAATLALSFDVSGDMGSDPSPIQIESFGRNSVAVDQPLGGGSNYPFVDSGELTNLIADLYLYYQDASFVRPFSVAWVFGFDDGPGAVPITTAHAKDMLIVDAFGTPVFDSREADEPVIQNWSDRLQIVQWKTSDGNILRTTIHTAWSADQLPVVYPIYIAPTNAVLDERTEELALPRVNSVRDDVSLGAGRLRAAFDIHQHFKENIRLKNGLNTEIKVTPGTVGPVRTPTIVTFSAVPGSGDGRFDPGCDEEPVIRRINNITADAAGNILLDVSQCYRVERPIYEVLNSNPAAHASAVLDHMLQLFNDCSPCCTCQDYVNSYEGVRKLRNTFADLVERTNAVRELYISNLNRFNSQKGCRESQVVRVATQPVCPDELQVTVGICNTSNECLNNVILYMSFEYADAAGDPDPEHPNMPLTAHTTYSGGATPNSLCAFTTRGGNIDTNPAKGLNSNAPRSYVLGGSWPNFYVLWDRISPGGMGSITTRFIFQDSGPSDLIQVVFDAYKAPPSLTGSIQINQASNPNFIPGYVIGQGPLTDQAKSLRLGLSPAKVSSGLLQHPCCGDTDSLS